MCTTNINHINMYLLVLTNNTLYRRSPLWFLLISTYPTWYIRYPTWGHSFIFHSWVTHFSHFIDILPFHWHHSVVKFISLTSLSYQNHWCFQYEILHTYMLHIYFVHSDCILCIKTYTNTISICILSQIIFIFVDNSKYLIILVR